MQIHELQIRFWRLHIQWKRMAVCLPYFDPEYENLNEEIYGPRVSVDNDSCEKCTVVKVDSVNIQGLLLKAVQIITDLDLVITKSYISSDAGWLMDVFHVKDQSGNKVNDRKILKSIQQALGQKQENNNPGEAEKLDTYASGSEASIECTAIEMIGNNRPGLFSEISAALSEQRCHVVEAHAWSNNDCLACVAYISDEFTSTSIDDPNRLSTIEDRLSNILGDSIDGHDSTRVRTCSLGCDNLMGHTERRLHQLMFQKRDFDCPRNPVNLSSLPVNMDDYQNRRKAFVSIDRCKEKGYTVVNVECLDRPKLMFDTVCTLIDMQYVVFHASISSCGNYARQEYFIRNKDGSSLISELEVQRVAKCLEAAIERRVCQGIRIEIDLQNNVGVLPYLTRCLREHGLNVTHADIAADIATHGVKTKSKLYIEDISGKKVDMGVMELMQKEMEPLAFQVKNDMPPQTCTSTEGDRSPIVSLIMSNLERFSHSFI
ncbi:ACT domain-containing protein ACR2-like isoform X1 [Zingiber officinale]|uniref:ACT domain-containing protein ACR2-like isoform X1 n=1 Tax=Zingiber officinale TaxID=94328 RepID=UPI001C4C4C4B|nr:ACT domain-containing protein ACR2-like isoform X1 [Zingiber officinale]XP_042473885.1 ACT domain-containing protein ACR2-like isoform X1 [Zingiber officinale]